MPRVHLALKEIVMKRDKAAFNRPVETHHDGEGMFGFLESHWPPSGCVPLLCLEEGILMTLSVKSLTFELGYIWYVTRSITTVFINYTVPQTECVCMVSVTQGSRTPGSNLTYYA